MEALIILAILGFLAYKGGILGPAAATPAQLPGIAQSVVGQFTQAVDQSLAGSGGSVSGTTAEVSGAASAVAAGAGALNSVVPGLGSAVNSVLQLLKSIFKGADPNQVPAAKCEQVYECFGEICHQLQVAGLISRAASVSFIQAAISASAVAEQSAPQYASDPTPFNKGMANAANCLNADVQAANMLADVPLQPLTLAAAQALYMGAYPSPGWYSSSVQLAYQLANAMVNALIYYKTQ